MPRNGPIYPRGWAFDKDGQSTTDPNAALMEGQWFRLERPREPRLSLMVEILAASLTGRIHRPICHHFLHHLVHRRMPIPDRD